MQSRLERGNNGFLGLILTPEKCFIVTGYAFEPHVNSGALPVMSPNATQHQILNTNAIHKENLRLRRDQTFVRKALKIN